MRRSKFSPALETMEFRLTLSSATANLAITSIATAAVVAPGGNSMARTSSGGMDFSGNSTPDTVPYYCDPMVSGSDQPMDPAYRTK